MNRFVVIVSATLRQVLGTRRVVIFGLAALVPAALLLLGARNESGEELLQIFLGTGYWLHFFLAVPITTLTLSAAALGEERRGQTLSFLVLRPIPRGAIAGAKLTAAVLGALALNVGGAAAMSVAYASLGGDWGYLVPMVAGSAVATVIYASLFVPLGYLSERSTLIGLVFVFIWEGGVAAIPSLATTSPVRLGFAAYVSLAPAGMLAAIEEEVEYVLGNITPSASAALVQAAVLLAISIAFVTWLLRTRDLV